MFESRPTTSFIHPTAIVETDQVGDGTRVWAYAHILAGARVGGHCNICDHAYIEGGAVLGNNVTVKNHVCIWEGVTLEDDVFVGPFVSFTNDLRPRSPRMPEARRRYAHKENWLVPTVVEQGCTIGANATIVAGVRLGRYSFIAAGATVTSDVEPFALVRGVPARKVGYVCRCGNKLETTFLSETCLYCGATPEIMEMQLAESNDR